MADASVQSRAWSAMVAIDPKGGSLVRNYQLTVLVACLIMKRRRREEMMGCGEAPTCGVVTARRCALVFFARFGLHWEVVSACFDQQSVEVCLVS